MSNYKRGRSRSGGYSPPPKKGGSGKNVVKTLAIILAAAACVSLFAGLCNPRNHNNDDDKTVVVRDITKYPLTAAEKSAISALKPDDIKECYTVRDLAPRVYEAANVNVSPYFGKTPSGNSLTNFWIGYALFASDGSLRTEDDEAYIANCTAMLVEGYYGGTKFNSSRTFVEDDFEIGDLFCGYKTVDGKKLYYTAVYQGNGLFLAADQSSGTTLYLQDLNTVFAEDIGSTFTIYYVLRPAQLAANN